jgi:hypothetical protein
MMADGAKLPLLSLPWIDRYLELWHENHNAIDGTRGLAALVEGGLHQFGDIPTEEWD